MRLYFNGESPADFKTGWSPEIAIPAEGYVDLDDEMATRLSTEFPHLFSQVKPPARPARPKPAPASTPASTPDASATGSTPDSADAGSAPASGGGN